MVEPPQNDKEHEQRLFKRVAYISLVRKVGVWIDRLVRAIRAVRVFLFRWKTILCGASAATTVSAKFMEWAGIGEDVPIENSLINKAIEEYADQSQGYYFDIRKHLVEYDDVVNNQRKIIYDERRKILSGADLRSMSSLWSKRKWQILLLLMSGRTATAT